MFPIGTDRPQRRAPVVNILLIAANIIVFLLTHGNTGGGAGAGHGAYALLPGVKDYILAPNPRLFQFITYQFLHQDFWHLAGNMLFLYVFGNNLNEKLGNVGYLAFYLAGGIFAGCGQVFTSGSPTLGASGSISAVTGLFFVLLPRTNVRVFVWFYLYVDVLEIPSMWFIAFSMLKDLFEARFFGDSGVAHYAHLSGNLSGVLVGFLLMGTRLVQRDHYDLIALVSRWRRRREYEQLVSKGFDPFMAGTNRGMPAKVRQGTLVDPRVSLLRDSIATLIRTHQIPVAAQKYMELKLIDRGQVMLEGDQLDLANQLMAEGKYDIAAQAYEDYLRVYKEGRQGDQVELMLGLIYARYLPDAARATMMLRAALARLHDGTQRAMAESELQRLTGPAA